MADIESVRLPDNSTFNIKDPTALHGTDGINALADVSASSPSDSDLLIYNGSTSKWTAQANPFTKPNLLINPWFTVDERGASSYTSVSSPIDAMNGWELTDTEASGTTMTKGSSGWSFSGDYARLRQISSEPYCDEGSVVTISLKVNGTVYSITDVIESNVKYKDIPALGIRVYYRTTVFSFTETSAHLTNLQAVKLELGTISTLANDTEPNYTLELLKCQNANVSGLSNENLLLNPCFSVNQRGATTITSGSGADGWKLEGGTSATFGTNQVTLTGALVSQWRENQLPNGTYTASVKLLDGTIYSGTLTKTNDTDSLTFIHNSQIIVAYISSLKRFDLNTANVTGTPTTTVVYTKLEPGSVSTLANDVEQPNYTSEVLKCQRYFKRIGGGDIGIGIATATTLFDVFIPTGVPMRMGTPTVTYTGTISLQDTTGTITSILSAEKATNPNTKIRFNATGLTVGSVSRVAISNDGYIDISAEL